MALSSLARSVALPLTLAASLAPAPIPGARLQPESVAGWNAYVAATEQRIAKELTSRDRFLAMDFAATSAADRAAALAGGIVTREVETRDGRGATIHVPSAIVHHWRGAILIPHVTLTGVLTRLQSTPPGAGQEDVLQSAVLSRGQDWMKVYLKLQRTKFVTAVYNTEHLVTYRRYSPQHASSMSTATKIAELADVGTPAEHELPPGDDRGFLWRLNAYWRYEEVSGDVIAECESISLSRDIPFGFGALVMPMVRSTASESLEKTLKAVRAEF